MATLGTGHRQPAVSLTYIYNTNEKIMVYDNRFVAFHLGFDGQPTDRLSYRALATWQKGWGTYSDPFTKAHQNVSFMLEVQGIWVTIGLLVLRCSA